MIERVIDLLERAVAAYEKDVAFRVSRTDGRCGKATLRGSTADEGAVRPEDKLPPPGPGFSEPVPEPAKAEVVAPPAAEPDRDSLVRTLNHWGVTIPPRTRTTTLVQMVAEARLKRVACAGCEGAGCVHCGHTGYVLPVGPVTAEAEAVTPAPEPAGMPVSLDELVAVARRYVADHGRGALVAKLSEYGVQTLSAIPEDKRAEFMAGLASA